MPFLIALFIAASSLVANANEADSLTEILRPFDRYARVITSDQMNQALVDRPDNVQLELANAQIGVIRVRSFKPTNTCTRVNDAVDQLSQAGARQFVLDLRDNPGGQPMVAVCVASVFLGQKIIVGYEAVPSTIPHLEKWVDDLDGGPADVIDWTNGLMDQKTEAPLIVLINNGTASAAEIVAGALKDHHRAKLLGERSFGKGSAQDFKPIKGHPDLWLGYTVEKYVNPSGFSPDGVGIEPSPLSKDEQTCVDSERRPAQAADSDLANALAVLSCDGYWRKL